MDERHGWTWRSLTSPAHILGALVVALFLHVGCGDDDSPAPFEPEEPFPASRATPESLLTSWLEKAIALRDSAHLADALAPDFRFQFGPETAESLQARGVLPEDSVSWERSRDLAVMAQVFRSARVRSTSMDVRWIRSNTPDSMCAECRLIDIDTRVRITIDFESEPITYGGDFRQMYVVGPDPDHVGLWVVKYQIDDQYFYKQPDAIGSAMRSAGLASVPDTWSMIKSLFLLGWVQ